MRLHYNQKTIRAKISLPASKSISNRLLVLIQVLGISPTVKNLSKAQDTQDLLKAIRQIRAGKKKIIDIGDAGTDMRFLTALLSVTKGEWLLTGSERMKQRPIAELVNALRQLGAEISYAGKNGFPPLKIRGKNLEGGKVELDASISSQFISALLLIAPSFKKGLQVKLKNQQVSLPYIQMTIEILQEFGFKCGFFKNTIVFPPDQIKRHLKEFRVESDWSAASYWYNLAALSDSANIILTNIQKRSIQGDRVLSKIYEQFGVRSVFSQGDLHLSSSGRVCQKFEYDFTDCPDLAQTVAVTCFGLQIPCTLTGLSTLKNKETDRILALKTELSKLGAKVKTTNSSISISPASNRNKQHKPHREAPFAIALSRAYPAKTRNIATYGDHRMAMSFAPLALFSDISIEDPKVVQKSYPDFWKDLHKAGIFGKSYLKD